MLPLRLDWMEQLDKRPVMLQGRPLPLSALSPDEFQAFVYVAFTKLAPTMGFEVSGLTGAGGDGGFDIDGRREDARVVCIQCKRSAHLELNDAATELAKVGLNSFLDETDTIEHIIVASGTLAKNLEKASRQIGRTTLIERALLQAPRELSKLFARVVQKGGDPEQTIRDYIVRLQRLEVWSGTAFDAHLGRVWTAIQDAIERAFAVHVVLKEHPRPDFDEQSYLARSTAPSNVVPQSAIRQNLPPNLRVGSLGSEISPKRDVANDPQELPAVEALLGTSPGEIAVVCGRGGGGKTSTMVGVANAAAAHRAIHPSMPLPVLLALKEYGGEFDSLVHRELGIMHGHWRSIPGTFLFLLDGLNELPPEDAQRMLGQLRNALRDERTAVVISCRDIGPSRPVVADDIARCWSIAPFTIGQTRRLATQILPRGEVAPFIDEILRRHAMAPGSRLLSLPFVVRAAIDFFASKGALPESLSQIIDDLLTRRYRRNEELDASQREPEIPETTLRELAGEVAYQLCLVHHRASVRRPEIQDIVHRARLEVVSRHVFGADGLSDAAALSALLRHEYLVRSRTEHFSFSHDLIAGFLAAPRLAAVWRDHLDDVYEPTATDAWLFAVRNASAGERAPMCEEIAKRDPVMAADSALEAGMAEDFGDRLLRLEPSPVAGTFASSRWMEACAGLGTSQCLARLRVILRTTDPNSSRYNQAHYALCTAGDVATLRAVLSKVDLMQIRTMEMTGGEIDLWRTAPAMVALTLARERIAVVDQHDYLGESAYTLGRYGDETDADRLAELMQSTANLDTLLFAADALYRFDEDRARDVLATVALIADERARIDIYSWLAHRGGRCDTKWLVDVLRVSPDQLSERWMAAGLLTKSEQAVAEASMYQLTVAKVLQRTPLSPDDIAGLVAAFSSSDRYTRPRIWSIATEHSLAEFDEAAFAAIDAAASGPYDDIGAACNLAATRDWSKEDHDRALRQMVVFTRRDDARFTWELARALVYLLKKGARAHVATTIESHLAECFAKVDAAAANRPCSLNVDGERVFARTGVQSLRDVGPHLLMMREVISEVADDLPVELRRRFLGVDTSEGHAFECHRRVIVGVPADQLDDELERIQDPRLHEYAIVRLAALGSTPRRVAAWCKSLLHWGKRPVNNAMLIAARQLWCNDVALALVELVVVEPWDADSSALAHQVLKDNVLPFDRDMLPVIDKGITRASDEARNILILWAARARRQLRGSW